jgi:hypothetical protein
MSIMGFPNLPAAPIKRGDPGCEDCDFKMQCLSLQVAPCTVQHLDLIELYKIYSHETVLKLIRGMFIQDEA